MKTIPNSIKKKLERYAKYEKKAEILRCEIEEWFLNKGIDTDVDMGNSKGRIITDIIIDIGLNGNVEEANYINRKSS